MKDFNLLNVNPANSQKHSNNLSGLARKDFKPISSRDPCRKFSPPKYRDQHFNLCRTWFHILLNEAVHSTILQRNMGSQLAMQNTAWNILR